MPKPLFKRCGYCGTCWPDRGSFLGDPGIGLIGYQANAVIAEKGLLLFNHDCGNTLSIEVAFFADLHDGPLFREEPRTTNQCPGHCLHRGMAKRCPVRCECTYVRELLQLLKEPSAALLQDAGGS